MCCKVKSFQFSYRLPHVYGMLLIDNTGFEHDLIFWDAAAFFDGIFAQAVISPAVVCGDYVAGDVNNPSAQLLYVHKLFNMSGRAIEARAFDKPKMHDTVH